jgi:hypothetical protein
MHALRRRNGMEPLHMAALSGSVQCVQCLLFAGVPASPTDDAVCVTCIV